MPSPAAWIARVFIKEVIERAAMAAVRLVRDAQNRSGANRAIVLPNSLDAVRVADNTRADFSIHFAGRIEINEINGFDFVGGAASAARSRTTDARDRVVAPTIAHCACRPCGAHWPPHAISS